MLQHSPLNQVFQALSDPTRRAIAERLVAGPVSVSDLAEPFSFSLSAIGQHVHLLESSGIVRTAKLGRVRRVELVPERLALAERWFATHRARWERRLDRLGSLLAEISDDQDPRGGQR
jgi:DNA-binding transcriptional ArsR family regulator